MADVQNHIHLDTAVGATPENAPTLTWKTIDREEEVMFFASVQYTLGGTPHLHVVKDAGDPVLKYNYNYMIKVMATDSETIAQRKADLIALAGQRLYLVDHEHPDDGSDHAAYVRTVALVELGPFKRDVTNLSFYYVSVTLKDLSTS